MEAYQITLLVAVVLGMLELATGAFLFLGLALGAVAVAALQGVLGGLSINRDLAVFSGVSMLAFWGLRKAFARPADQTTTEDDVNRY